MTHQITKLAQMIRMSPIGTQWRHDNEFIDFAKAHDIVLIYTMEYDNNMYIRGALNAEIKLDYDKDVEIKFYRANTEVSLQPACIIATIKEMQTYWSYNSTLPLRSLVIHDKGCPIIAKAFKLNSPSEINVEMRLTINEECEDFLGLLERGIIELDNRIEKMRK